MSSRSNIRLQLKIFKNLCYIVSPRRFIHLIEPATRGVNIPEFFDQYVPNVRDKKRNLCV
jgi:hypothetical protein